MRELDYSQKGNLESDLNQLEALMDNFFEISKHYTDINQYFDRFRRPDDPSETFQETMERYLDIEEKISDLSGKYNQFKTLADMFRENEHKFSGELRSILQRGSAKFNRGSYLERADSQ